MTGLIKNLIRLTIYFKTQDKWTDKKWLLFFVHFNEDATFTLILDTHFNYIISIIEKSKNILFIFIIVWLLLNTIDNIVNMRLEK